MSLEGMKVGDKIVAYAGNGKREQIREIMRVDQHGVIDTHGDKWCFLRGARWGSHGKDYAVRWTPENDPGCSWLFGEGREEHRRVFVLSHDFTLPGECNDNTIEKICRVLLEAAVKTSGIPETVQLN